MQVSINDYCGTKVLHVFKLSGESAKEGEDFAPWRGAYHKNGKWSYTEGGVAMRNGILLLNRRSTHRKWNDIMELIILIENEKFSIHIGKFSELPQRPKNRHGGLITDEAFDAIIEWLLNYSGEEERRTTTERWEQIEKFL